MQSAVVTGPRLPSSRCVRCPPLRGPLEGDLRARGAPRSAGGASGPGVDLLAWHRHRRCRDAVDRGRGHPERLRSEASFASLCGVAPIEASSGKLVRHRLNRGGNREANRALYMICLARMRRDRRTQEYVGRRTAEGKSKPEIIRCLKRYVAREVLPRAGLLRRPFLAYRSQRRGPHRRREPRRLTIGASLG
jgi:hypothetical protein